MKDWLHSASSSVVTYSIAIIAFFFNTAITYGGTIASLLGFVLLLAKLVQEVPKAYAVLFRKNTNDEAR